jgi:hypothetical protein
MSSQFESTSTRCQCRWSWRPRSINEADDPRDCWADAKTHTLREEVGYVVDALHKLRDLHGEMFVVVHVARTTLQLLPTFGDPSYSDAFRDVGLMLGP